MRLAVDNPNFSVIVPGRCNASCAFCCWKWMKEKPWPEYKETLKTILDRLPISFQQCTVTGGEPTGNRHLLDILCMLRDRFPKIVLSSNGYDLTNSWIFQNIDHINLSRHHYSQKGCYEIFKTRSIPSDQDVKGICWKANRYGVDVTLNCVLDDRWNSSDIVDEFVGYARRLGASAVKFRKEIGSLTPHAVEEDMKASPVHKSECPVCVTNTYLWRGMNVLFTRSVKEPSVQVDRVYEAILHPNGNLTSDWDAQVPIEDPVWRPEEINHADLSELVEAATGDGCRLTSYRGC